MESRIQGFQEISRCFNIRGSPHLHVRGMLLRSTCGALERTGRKGYAHTQSVATQPVLPGIVILRSPRTQQAVIASRRPWVPPWLAQVRLNRVSSVIESRPRLPAQQEESRPVFRAKGPQSEAVGSFDCGPSGVECVGAYPLQRIRSGSTSLRGSIPPGCGRSSRPECGGTVPVDSEESEALRESLLRAGLPVVVRISLIKTSERRKEGAIRVQASSSAGPPAPITS